MKSVLLTLATAAALFAGANTSALANDTFNAEVGGSGQDHFKSTKTRAEVQARARGQTLVSDSNYPAVVQQKLNRTRVEVTKEYLDYVKSGQKANDDAFYCAS